MIKNSLLALGLLAALPFAASAADGLSYNYVEGGYVNTDAKGGDADGWGVKGSVAVHPNFHIFGDYSKQETDTFKNDVDQWRIGAGYNYGIAPKHRPGGSCCIPEVRHEARPGLQRLLH